MADDTTKLDLDTARYIAGMEQVLKWTNKYSTGMKEAAVASLTFNDAGQQTDAVVNIIAQSGEKITASLTKIKKGYEVAGIEISKTLQTIRAEQKKLADDKSTEKALKNLTEFRKVSGTQLQRSVFPKGGSQTDYRSLFGDLDKLEAYVSRGQVSAKRAQAIITSVQSGTSKRISKSPVQESFRQDALKLYADAETLGKRIEQRRTRARGAVDALKVDPILGTALNKAHPGIDPFKDASASHLNQGANAFLKIRNIVETGTLPPGRFQDLVTKYFAGAADPVGKAELQIVQALDKLHATIAASKERGAKLAGRAASSLAGQKSGGTIDNAFGVLRPGAASTAQIDQVEAAKARITKILTNPSSSVTGSRFEDLVQKYMAGAADPITVAEQAITRSLKRIDDTFRSAQDKANKAAQRLTNRKDAGDVGSTLKSNFSLGHLDTQNLERVYAQIAKIQNLVASGKLTSGQFANVFDSVQKGAKTNFVGAEEQARSSITKIKGIISGELKNPFEVQIGFGQSFSALKGLIAANFALELVERFKAAVTSAAEFQRQIALIQTITQDANLTFNQWAQGIRAVSDELGKPIGEIAAAGYDLLSNQVTKATDTFNVLRSATQFARITNSSTEDSVNLLSTAINTFRLNTSEAERVLSQFFTVIDLGRVKAAGLANSGRTFEFGKTVGASIEEINASIITLTQSGIKEDNALTLLNNVFQKLLNPTKDLQQLYDKLGVSTGETFIKTYGFAGALQKLKEATGGSSAKLADLFNEIRGFQGIDNLISRIDIFNDSLHQLDSSYERAAEAKKKFDNLPGQQFLEQTNKLTNLLLTGFQTTVLEKVLEVSKAFGGLDNAVVEASKAAFGLISAVGAVAGGAKILEGIDFFKKQYESAQLATTSLTQTKFAVNELGGAALRVLPLLNFAVAAAGFSYVGLQVLELKDKIDGTYESIIKVQTEATAALEKADQASRADGLKKFEEDLNKRRQSLLGFVAVYKQVLNTQGTELDKLGKSQQGELKNALELSLKSSKNSLQALINQQEAALKSIADLKKRKAGLGDEQGGLLFNFALAKDDALTGGTNEKQIYQQRLDQLTKLQHAAAQRGDVEHFDKYTSEKKSLVGQLSTARDDNGNLKYYGQEQAIKALIAEENQLLQVQINLKKQQAIAAEKQILATSRQVKTAEDAAKALYEFSLKDSHTGKLLDKDKESALKRYQGLKTDYDRANDALNKNPTLNRGQYREVDVATSAKLKADRDKEVEKQFALHFGTTEKGGAGKFKHQDLDEFGNSQSTSIDAQVRKSRDIDKSVTESTAELNKAQVAARATVGTLHLRDENLKSGFGIHATDEDIVVGRGETNASKQRDTLLDQYHRELNAQHFGGANDAINKLEALFKQNGALNNTYSGGPNNTSITIQEGLNQIRANTNRVQEAAKTNDQNLESRRSLVGSSEVTFQPIQDLFTKYGDVAALSKTVDGQKAIALSGMAAIEDLLTAGSRLAKNMAAVGDQARQARQATLNAPTSTPPSGHSMGGDISYYAEGGSTRGIDSVNAMLAPGEFVMNPGAAQRFHSQLVAMNSGFDSGSRGSHGSSTTNVGDIHVSVNGGGTSAQSIKEIAAGIQRELRRGTISLRG